MLVKIFKLGEDEVVNTFPLGSHVLGRGASLKCNDKRISRNHATIEITPDNVKLTSVHINPCFLRAAESKTITILKKDTSKELNDGDAFAFLPDDFWFRIKICEDAPSKLELNDEASVTAKRCLDEYDDNAPPDKKTKMETDNCESNINNLDATRETADETETNPSENENGTAAETISNPEVECKSEEEQNVSLKEETAENANTVDNYDVPQNVEVQENIDENAPPTEDDSTKQGEDNDNGESDKVATKLDQTQPSKDNDDGNPSTSNPKSKREKCWYGAQCYRKNPVHRQDYTHPGDSDYESDSDDNRPTCSYGATCYRKNKDHRRDYKHPPRQPPSKKKRTRKKVDRLNLANSQEMREFDDSEDPFIADDDSDEYTGGSDEEDSDWDDSQEADEDVENVKRLVKEANRFAKK